MRPTCAGIALALSTCVAGAQEFTFDPSEFEKKAFEFGGYGEIKLESMRLRPDSVPYHMTYPEGPSVDALERFTGTLELAGKWTAGAWVSDFRTRSSYATDALDSSLEKGVFMEGGIRWKPSDRLWFDLGKRTQRWGKGYAWNPVGFIERPKDPDDAQAAREGYYMFLSEWVRTFEGPLATLSVTAAAVPRAEGLNEDFGKLNHTNPALRLSGLFHDTDLDLYWLGKGSRPERFGMDFSRNLGPSLEVHGEWALGLDVPRTLVAADGRVSQATEDTHSYLLGFRYITTTEITWIVEYYRNGSGYTEAQLADYDSFAQTALAPGAPPQLSSRLATLSQSGYAKANPGRDYLYLRASLNEPFGWLYTTLALTGIVNLDDRSRQVTPEISYTGFSNIELRGRLALLSGGPGTEFGRKMTERRLEVYARFYF